MCTECQLLIKSINSYIAKENDKLADELKKAGFADQVSAGSCDTVGIVCRDHLLYVDNYAVPIYLL